MYNVQGSMSKAFPERSDRTLDVGHWTLAHSRRGD
jgi:hypothetical protein